MDLIWKPLMKVLLISIPFRFCSVELCFELGSLHAAGRLVVLGTFILRWNDSLGRARRAMKAEALHEINNKTE